jgi:hypothetical protein
MKRWLILALAACSFGAERYIAIDNVCAWPNVKKLPDRNLLAVIFNQPSHGGREGDVEAWISRDGGKLWARAGTPAPHEPGASRLNVAFGLAHDGSPIVLSAGVMVEKRPDRWLPVWVCRSPDGGRTWTRSTAVTLPEGVDYLIPFGDIVRLPGRRLAASAYHHYGAALVGKQPSAERKAPGGSAYILFSDDDGLTWGGAVLIGKDDYNEATLLRVNETRLLAAARTYRSAHLELFASEDDGRTWKNEGPVSLPSQHPASLTLLRDGRILLTYGIRERGNRAVAVRTSSDQGRSWGAAWPVVTLEGAGDSGYPSTVQLDDGTLVTAWYADGMVTHRRYHMGVLRWRLEP